MNVPFTARGLVWAEMPHVWHAFAGLLPEADEAVERIGRWLREDRATR
jgi:acetyl esterase/lipase